MPDPDLPASISRTRQRATGRLAELDPAAAAWVERIGSARPAIPAVVVVGEAKRGKSSLVNALLATQGLSPADAVAATAVSLVLRHGPCRAATAHHPGGPPLGVPIEDLTGWVTGREPSDGSPPPRWLDVRAPVPLLERLTLVDTPGVGGLHRAHADLAREAVCGATAVLFVLDASAPITRGELDFLAGLGGQVETVLFALTKTDLHRGWRAVLDADRELLARHAPRFAAAPVYPVSARLFERAATAGAEVAPVLRARSGVAELQVALQRQVGGRAALLGEANTLRALCTAMDGLVARLHAGQQALESGESQASVLRARRAELSTALRSADRSWQVRLRAEVQRARVESSHQVAGQVRAMHTRLRAVVDAADRGTLEQVPYQVDASLQVLATQVGAGLAARVGRIADAALADVFTPDELGAVRSGLVRHGRPLVLTPPAARARSAEDKLLIAVGVSGGLGIGRLAALPLAEAGLAGGALVLPVSIALGLGAGWWMARTRRHTADKAHLAQWLADVLAEARGVLEQTVAEQMIDAEHQVALALEQALARRIAGIEEELREVDDALRMAHAERERAIDVGRARLAEATAQRAAVGAALGHLQELRDQPV